MPPPVRRPPGVIRKLIYRVTGRVENTLPPFNFKTNPYQAKKVWPPKLMELTPRQQFHFERRYKRRLLLASTYTTWNKWVKITTWVIIGWVTVYSIFFYDFRDDSWNPQPGEQPFSELRAWTKELFLGTFGFNTNAMDVEMKERGARRDPKASDEAYANDTTDSGVGRRSK